MNTVSPALAASTCHVAPFLTGIVPPRKLLIAVVKATLSVADGVCIDKAVEFEYAVTNPSVEAVYTCR